MKVFVTRQQYASAAPVTPAGTLAQKYKLASLNLKPLIKKIKPECTHPLASLNTTAEYSLQMQTRSHNTLQVSGCLTCLSHTTEQARS